MNQAQANRLTKIKEHVRYMSLMIGEMETPDATDGTIEHGLRIIAHQATQVGKKSMVMWDHTAAGKKARGANEHH